MSGKPGVKSEGKMHMLQTRTTKMPIADRLCKNSGNFIEILRITGAYGVRGFLRAVLFSDNIGSYDAIYDVSGKKFGFRVVRFVSGNSVILSIDGLEDRDAAESLAKTLFYAKKVKIQNNAEFYVCDLVGKTVKIIGNDAVCTIVGVHNFGAGDLIELSSGASTFLVPFTEDNFPTNAEGNIVMTSEAFNWYKD